MRAQTGFRSKILRNKFLPVLVLLPGLLLSFSNLQGETDFQSSREASQGALDPGVKQQLSIAETQHEIVKLLIRQGQYQRVPAETKKIFDLNLPDRYEEAVAQSASLIAGMLAERQQFTVAHAVLEEGLKRMKRNENKAALLKIEGYVYKSEGNFEKALESLEKAVQLERQRARP